MIINLPNFAYLLVDADPGFYPPP